MKIKKTTHFWNKNENENNLDFVFKYIYILVIYKIKTHTIFRIQKSGLSLHY